MYYIDHKSVHEWPLYKEVFPFSIVGGTLTLKVSYLFSFFFTPVKEVFYLVNFSSTSRFFIVVYIYIVTY